MPAFSNEVIELECRMTQYQEDTRDEVLAKAEKLQRDGWESYLNPWSRRNYKYLLNFCSFILLKSEFPEYAIKHGIWLNSNKEMCKRVSDSLSSRRKMNRRMFLEKCGMILLTNISWHCSDWGQIGEEVRGKDDSGRAQMRPSIYVCNSIRYVYLLILISLHLVTKRDSFVFFVTSVLIFEIVWVRFPLIYIWDF